MTSAVQALGVVVPARDEQELLPGALAALGVAASRVARLGTTVDLLVVADSCTDNTAEVARAAGVPVLEVDAGAVGLARAAGLRHLLDRLSAVPRSRLWLATTDADSQVPPHWLSRQLELATTGADLVVGTVEVDDWSAHPPYVEQRWRAGYDRRDGHGHVHGANVGARADAYLHRRVVRTGTIPVLTSARLRSRAAGGFADHLAGLASGLTTPAARGPGPPGPSSRRARSACGSRSNSRSSPPCR